MTAAIVWDVAPEVFEGFHVRWYGVLFATGFLIAYQVLKKIFATEGYDMKTLDGITFAAFLGTVIGARLGHCLFYEPGYYLSHPAEIIMVWKGGLASHGGVLGVMIACWIYAKKNKIDLLWLISRVAIATPLTGACIRLGNLMNSEIYGHETDLPWGIIFARAGETVAKHPTQLYEALGYIIVFAVQYSYYTYQAKKNIVASKYMLPGMFFFGIFAFRFLIEFVKMDQVEFESGMLLNMGQLLSIPFLVLGIGFMLYAKKLQRQS